MRTELEDAPRAAGAGEDRSLGDLVRSLTADVSLLVREEIALARLELRSAVARARRDLALLGAGTGVALVGAMALVAAVVVLLGGPLGSYWLSALIVAAALFAAAALLGLRGVRGLRKTRLAPDDTLSTLRDTGAWARREATQLRASVIGGAPGTDGARATEGRAAAVPASRSPVAPAVVAPPEGGNGRAGRGARRDGPDDRLPPPRSAGWMPFLKHVGREIGADDVTGQAAKLAYYAFMAMPPALMALFGLAGLVGSERIASWLEEQSAVALPGAVNETIIRPFIEQVVLNKAPGAFSVGLLLALWGASSAFAGLMDSLNVAWDVEETRSFVKKRAIALGMMLGGTVLFILAALTLLAGPELAKAVGLGGVGTFLWTVVRWPLTFAFVVGAFWIMYYLLPNRDQKGCKKVLLKAAAVAALLWVLATAAFRLYIANFSSYSETYGFLGAFIILLLWLFVSGIAMLAGGELAAEMEQRA